MNLKKKIFFKVYESPMRAPGEPIVHNRLIVREEVPAPPRPPPPVEISPAPRCVF